MTRRDAVAREDRFAARLRRGGRPLRRVALLGPAMHFSKTWQLLINTPTMVLTYLMLFVLQGAKNRGAAAWQAKLDELLHARGADSRKIGIDRGTDGDVRAARGAR